MPESKKPGAPKGNQNGVKGEKPATAWIQIRVDPEEKAYFQEQASAEQLTLSEWALIQMRNARKK